MSSLVVTPSLLTGKRRFEEEEAYQPDLDKQPISAHKRSRLAASCSPLACRAPLAPNNNGSHAGALDLLRSLFPGMNDKILSEALVDCDGNIDAAIRRLGILSLSADGPSAPETEQTAQASAAQSNHTHSSAGVHSTVEEQPASSSAAHAGPQTAEQWVEYLVGQLATAGDMQSAKVKAASVLQQFEAFVQAFSKQQAASSEASVNARSSKLVEENAVLKKAVAIQHRQLIALQERAAGVEDVGQLREALAAAQAQVRSLEMTNYSLALHLQKATGGEGGGYAPPGSRNPDVF